ncbi:MAG: NADH:ubiquinone reductase (Na(+)-transporting) subunit C [Bacteroides sp.]|jgi:Na+-transporting NADH:ubiquinone oxidoreductase subunit C|nr:NADH:ubiquinone reductase (Na(+)-transporting) subunit C [Bacteroides sp.]
MYSNKYIFIYSSVMVLIVALLLSAAAMFLKPMQERNMRIEKMQNILASINITASRGEAETLFDQYIVETKVVNSKGEEIEGNAFNVNLQDENRKAPEERQLPVFIADVDGDTYYIVPLRGNGLWGAIWGYFSLASDLETVVGANFDHASETPGLGAEISQREFENQFAGKRIFDEEGTFTPVTVVKGGAPEGDPHGVDAISGGTITSNGVTNMIRDGLGIYESYFLKLKSL